MELKNEPERELENVPKFHNDTAIFEQFLVFVLPPKDEKLCQNHQNPKSKATHKSQSDRLRVSGDHV